MELGWVNFIKATCIILVVFYHVTVPGFYSTVPYLNSDGIIANFWLYINLYLSNLRMPAFFFISGFLFRGGVGEYDLCYVIKNKTLNLLYLYSVWCLIQWFCIGLVVDEFNGQRISNNINSFYANSFGTFVYLSLIGMSGSWYLYALAFYFIVAKVFSRYRLYVFIIGLLLNYCVSLDYIDGWGMQGIARNFVYFVIGVFYSPFIIDIKKHIWKLVVLLFASSVHLYLGVNVIFFKSILVVIIFVALCRIAHGIRIVQVIGRLGKFTLPIYVLHRIFIELFGMSFINFVKNEGFFADHEFSIAWEILYPVMMTFLCIIFSLLTWYVFNKGIGMYLFKSPTIKRERCTTN